MDEKEKEEIMMSEEAKPTKRQEYLDYMRGSMGDGYGEDEEAVYSDMLDYRKSNEDAKRRLSDLMGEDPRLAQVLSDMSNGKRGSSAAMVRYFGKDFLGAEEGSEEWEAIEEAEKERLEELESMRKSKEEYDANIEASMPILDEFAKKHKLDADQFLEEVYGKILEPIFQGKYSEELLDTLHKAISYDTDVEDSFNSGVVAGRNEKIDKMRKKNVGDGMPRMGTSGGVEVNRPKRTSYRSSVWDKQ